MYSEADEPEGPVTDDAIEDFELSLPLDCDTCEQIRKATRFTQINLTQTWLFPKVQAFVQKAP